VDSVIGQGTTFNIYLPALEKIEAVQPKHIESIVSGREHILLVDDESIITRMLSQMLSNLGYHITPHNCPIEALALFRNAPERFDLVISDVTMPQMAGHDLAREMLKIRPDLPILLCTGHSDNINEKTADSIGVRALLYKPLTGRDLSTAIRGVLDCRSAA
jgi:two-component system, cell cycle sensor histidine kinase and response regulator CckA